MLTFMMCGGSDDIVHTEGVLGAKEFYVSGGGYRPCASFLLQAYDGEMRILAFYGAAGTAVWSFMPMQIAEGVDLPDWPMRIHTGEPSHGYSTVLEIEVPDGAVVSRLDL